MNDSNLNKNNLFNILSTFTNIVFPLIIFPYVSRILGADNIGKYNFSSSIISYFNLVATLGISTYSIRECSKLRDDRKSFSSLASDIYSINIYSMIIAYILMFIVLFFSFKLKSYSIYIFLLSFSFLFETLGTVWICNAMNDFRFLAIRSIIIHFLSLLATFFFVKIKNDLCIYIIILVISNSGSTLINILYRKKYCDIKFVFKPNISRHIKKIIIMFSQTISMLLYTNVDMIMLGYYFDDTNVGIYSVSVKIYNTVNMIISSVIGVAIPQLSYDYNNNDFNSFNKKLTYVVNFVMFLFMPSFVGLNMLSKEIILILSSEEYIFANIPLRILSFSLMFSLISAILGFCILFPMGLDKINFNSCIISSISNFVLNLYFIPKFGIVGAAITTTLAELFGIINKIKYIDKNIKIDKFLKNFITYLIGSIIVFIVCFIVKNLFIGPMLVFFISVVLSGLLYCIYLLFIKNEFFIELIRPFLDKFCVVFHK